MRKSTWIVLAAAALALGGCSSSNETSSSQQTKTEQAPDKFTVNLDTSKGPVSIEIYRHWGPIGADHFYQLVKSGFYDGARFFRIVPGFVVQFGIAGDPQATAKWKTPIVDEPVLQHNVRGSVTYAKTQMPNSRTAQIFINLGNNTESLDPQGFSPIGMVVKGMDIVDNLFSGYGQTPDQNLITQSGNAYLQGQFPMLDFIRKAAIQ